MQLLPTLVLLLTIDSAMTAGDTKHLFEDHGKATNFKPVITMRGRYTRNKEKKLVAVVLGSLSKLKRMNANFTETAQNTTNSLDKARYIVCIMELNPNMDSSYMYEGRSKSKTHSLIVR